MHFSSQVNFSRRFGKTIGSNIGGLGYEFKKHLETLSSIEQRQLFNDNLDLIIKSDLINCVWVYYEQYEQFFSELKNYILTMPDSEFNSIVNSTVLLGSLIDNFWLESNDPTLAKDYTFEKGLEQYKESVKKNGFTYDRSEEDENCEQFKMILKNSYYCRKNKDLVKIHFDMTQQLKYARIDDIIQSRTKENWEILYSLRYLYKNVVNMLINKNISGDNIFQLNLTNNTRIGFDFNNNVNYQINSDTNDSELYKIKQNLEDWLSLYQDSTEGLDWHNPYSNKPIESIEYFPRSTSKPEHEWAYSKYYDLENNAHNVVNNLINTRKRKREENNKQFEDRINKIKNLMEERNERIKKIAKYVTNGIYYGTRLTVLMAIGAIAYAFYI